MRSTEGSSTFSTPCALGSGPIVLHIQWFTRWLQLLLCHSAVAAPATGGEHSPFCLLLVWVALQIIRSYHLSPSIRLSLHCFTMHHGYSHALADKPHDWQPQIWGCSFTGAGVLASGESIQTGLESRTGGCRSSTARVASTQGRGDRSHSQATTWGAEPLNQRAMVGRFEFYLGVGYPRATLTAPSVVLPSSVNPFAADP